MGQLIELIKKIGDKPGMYIGTQSISNLFMFIQGYIYAHYEIENTSLQEDQRVLEGFQKWLEQRFNIQISRPWSSIILFYSDNEEQAFKKFYALFEEYIGIKS
jgi:hypothetical protein